MSKKKKITIGVVIAVVLIAALCVIYKVAKPSATAGTKSYTVSVVDADGNTVSYDGKTDAEYLRGLMDELSENEDFTYEGTDGDYGLYLDTINGLTADYDADGAYWAIYVNGEYANYGVDEQPVTDGDAFSFEYTIYQ